MRHAIVRGSVLAIAACFLSIAGCDKQSVGVEASQAASSESAPSGAAPSGDTCRLLTTAEVGSVFPGAKSPKRDDSREKYGISGCYWTTPHNRFGIQTYKSEPNAVENEARGLAEGFVDPLKPGARNNVRFEKLEGVGEGAIAVVETEDAQRGILHDVAMLVTQHGDQLIVLGGDELATSDRAAALDGLKRLGAAAVKRL